LRHKRVSGGAKKPQRAEFFTRCEYLIQQGSISTDDLENLDMLYDAYAGLGMNGAGAELYNRAKILPLTRKNVNISSLERNR
jgi:hypothetical protein